MKNNFPSKKRSADVRNFIFLRIIVFLQLDFTFEVHIKRELLFITYSWGQNFAFTTS